MLKFSQKIILFENPLIRSYFIQFIWFHNQTTEIIIEFDKNFKMINNEKFNHSLSRSSYEV